MGVNLLVQLPVSYSAWALPLSGLSVEEAESRGLLLSFHAYSDEMKARLLEGIAIGEEGVRVFVLPDGVVPRDGEWLAVEGSFETRLECRICGRFVDGGGVSCSDGKCYELLYSMLTSSEHAIFKDRLRYVLFFESQESDSVGEVV